MRRSKGALDGVVPRETREPLEEFVDLLLRWNRRINLLSRSEAADVWQRHVVDSAQLFPLAPETARTWLDLGSGAGFPGVVCAVLARTRPSAPTFTLVESDMRKAAFLREAVRKLGLEAKVLDARIEAVRLPPQDVISARALAPLDRLLAYAHPFCHADTRMLFPKGRNVSSELTLARRDWHTRTVRIPSLSDPEATILQISEVRRRS